MPQLTIDDTAVTVPAGKRLLNALIEEGHTDQLHACGGVGKCTTCRVQFTAGEPSQMTVVEKELLDAKGLTNTPGIRLSCQLTCDQDMSVKIISRLAGSGRRDAGGPPAAAIEPTPVWVTR